MGTGTGEIAATHLQPVATVALAGRSGGPYSGALAVGKQDQVTAGPQGQSVGTGRRTERAYGPSGLAAPGQGQLTSVAESEHS